MICQTPSRNARCVLLLLASVAASILSSGCSMTRVFYADSHMEAYLPALGRQTSYPLARTLTWKYYYTYGTGSYEQAWLIADGNQISSAKDASALKWYAALQVNSGARMSEALSTMGREASRQGAHQSAQIYHGASEAAMRSQIATEQLATAIGLGQAITGLGSALTDALVNSHATGAAQYLAEPERGVIGATAPEGTTLEVFFRGVKLDGKDANPQGTITMRWETVATLVDAAGKVWRSAAAFTTYHVFMSESDAPPAALNDGAYVRLAPNSLIPAHRTEYAREEAEMKKVLDKRGAAELGITAMHAIGDLYAQIEMAKGRP